MTMAANNKASEKTDAMLKNVVHIAGPHIGGNA
jgi:hypothetical protein